MIKVNSWNNGTYYIQTEEDKRKAMAHARGFRWPGNKANSKPEQKKAVKVTRKAQKQETKPVVRKRKKDRFDLPHIIFYLIMSVFLNGFLLYVIIGRPDINGWAWEQKPGVYQVNYDLKKVEGAEASTPSVSPSPSVTPSPTVKPTETPKPTQKAELSTVAYMRATWKMCDQNYAKIEKYAVEYKLPIQLLMAVASNESGCNPAAINDNGANGVDRGICQLNNLYHLPDDKDAFDIDKNLNYCALLLSNMWKKHGNWADTLGHFHRGGTNYNDSFGKSYAKKVLERAGFPVENI